MHQHLVKIEGSFRIINNLLIRPLDSNLDEESEITRRLHQSGRLENHLKKLEKLKQTLIKELAVPHLPLQMIAPDFSRPGTIAEQLVDMYEEKSEINLQDRMRALDHTLFLMEQVLIKEFEIQYKNHTSSIHFRFAASVIFACINLLILSLSEDSRDDAIRLTGFELAALFLFILSATAYYYRTKLNGTFSLQPETKIALANLISDFSEQKLRGTRTSWLAHNGIRFFTTSIAPNPEVQVEISRLEQGAN